jgi:hypothetical protein
VVVAGTWTSSVVPVTPPLGTVRGVEVESAMIVNLDAELEGGIQLE